MSKKPFQLGDRVDYHMTLAVANVSTGAVGLDRWSHNYKITAIEDNGHILIRKEKHAQKNAMDTVAFRVTEGDLRLVEPRSDWEERDLEAAAAARRVSFRRAAARKGHILPEGEVRVIEQPRQERGAWVTVMVWIPESEANKYNRKLKEQQCH